MTIINVELDDDLSAIQVSKIKDLLGLIRGVVRITEGGSYQATTVEPPESARMSIIPPGQSQSVNLDSINPQQKKYIISQAIAWGAKRGKITLSKLKRLNPEETMNLATNFLSEMPDSEKDKIFKEVT